MTVTSLFWHNLLFYLETLLWIWAFLHVLVILPQNIINFTIGTHLSSDVGRVVLISDPIAVEVVRLLSILVLWLHDWKNFLNE